jgi:hypothetical protein
MTICTKFGDDPLISSGVIAIFVFSVLALALVTKASEESDRTEIWSVRSSDLGVHVPSYRSIALAAMKHSIGLDFVVGMQHKTI